MAIVYCDYISGDDSTGDGSAGNPYKTITTASTGLTGGDEVRVAKSPDPTALTGTLTFTVNSTSLAGAGTAFTSELVIGDFVEGNDGHWYEVITITDDSTATLYQKYPGSTASGVSSRKLGVTSTGAAADSTTVIQSVSASGSSGSSLLKISGGWDLSTQTQTGQTWFRQMHGTFSFRYGYGLQASSKNYLEFDKVNFLRYYRGLVLSAVTYLTITNGVFSSNNYGIYYGSSNNNIITAATCNSNQSSGIYYVSSYNNIITAATCNSNSYGIHYYYSYNNTITAATCNSNQSSGIHYGYSYNNTITAATCNSNSYGIHYQYGAVSNIISDLTVNSNVGNAFYYVSFNANNLVYKLTGTGNIGLTKGSTSYCESPVISIQDNNGNGSINYFTSGQTTSDTASARSGICLKWTPSSATVWMEHVFKLKVATGTAYTVTFYLRKDSSFNGDIEAAIYNMGKEVVAYADKKPTSNNTYEAKTISIDMDDILAAGIAELRIRVRGTAGNCFLDDISIA